VSYQVSSYQPPSINLERARDFRGFRDSVKEALRDKTSYDLQFFQNLVQATNNNAQNYGTNITAAATIHPTEFAHIVTGATKITTIAAPQGFNGLLALIAQSTGSGFSTGTGGNISRAVTVAAGQFLLLLYFPPTSIWYTHL
jgi:hypothetical protein